MNCQINSSPMQTMFNAGLSSVHQLTDQISGNNPGIDWILTTADCVSVSFFRNCIERIDGAYCSDHRPVFAVVELQSPQEGIRHDWHFVAPAVPKGDLEVKEDEEGAGMCPVIPLH